MGKNDFLALDYIIDFCQIFIYLFLSNTSTIRNNGLEPRNPCLNLCIRQMAQIPSELIEEIMINDTKNPIFLNYNSYRMCDATFKYFCDRMKK